MAGTHIVVNIYGEADQERWERAAAAAREELGEDASMGTVAGHIAAGYLALLEQLDELEPDRPAADGAEGGVKPPEGPATGDGDGDGDVMRGRLADQPETWSPTG